MSDKLLVSTRKGLFTICRNTGDWQIADVDFLGDNVSITLADKQKYLYSFRVAPQPGS